MDLKTVNSFKGKTEIHFKIFIFQTTNCDRIYYMLIECVSGHIWCSHPLICWPLLVFFFFFLTIIAFSFKWTWLHFFYSEINCWSLFTNEISAQQQKKTQTATTIPQLNAYKSHTRTLCIFQLLCTAFCEACFRYTHTHTSTIDYISSEM